MSPTLEVERRQLRWQTGAAAAPAFLHAVTSPISLSVCLTHLLLHLQATHCEGFVKLVDRFVMLERQDAFQVGARGCWVLIAGGLLGLNQAARYVAAAA